MDFLIKPCAFLFIIFFTYFLKRAGLFHKDLALVVMKIIMNITLPAVAISAFVGFEGELALFWIVLIGLASALGSYMLMFFLTRKMKKEDRVYYIICASGFNAGCYGMPIISAFFGSIGTVIAALFDIGNCVMMASGNYAFTSVLLNTDGSGTKLTGKDLLKRFFSSVPTDVYLVLLVLSVLHISLPEVIGTFLGPMANANAFLSMFMLGLLFTPPRQKSDWKSTFYILVFRLGIMSVVAFGLFHLLPYSLEVRRILVLLLLCPIGSMSPGFIERCHGDGELAAFTNSVSTIASLIIMTVLAGLFQV